MTSWKEHWRLYWLPPLLVYIVIFAAQCSRTMFVIIVSWLALSITSEVASVGRVLVWSPLLSLFIGPFIGVAVDHYSRHRLLIVGEVIRIAGLIWLVLNINMGLKDLMPLHATAFIVYLGGLASIPSTHGLLQKIGSESITRIVTGAVSIGLAAEVVGAVGAGVAIGLFGTVTSLMICIAFSAVSAAFATTLKGEGVEANRIKDLSFVTEFTEGIRIIVRDRQLLLTCLTLTCAWAMAQTSLALLAGFTRFELRLGADAYGWIDAMWGGGGIAGAVTMACVARPACSCNLLAFGLLFLATATAAFSLSQDFWTALVFHGLMGAAFAFNMAICDAHILRTVKVGAIGRVRNNVQAAIGAVGVAVFLSPILYGDLPVRVLYLAFSAVVGAFAAMLLMEGRRHDPERR